MKAVAAEGAATFKEVNRKWIGRIPESWDAAMIKLVARLESGHTPSRAVAEYWENCTIPWFSLADVWQLREAKRKFVHETSELVSELGVANSSARVLPAGTVMLSRTASVGFTGIMGRDMATTQDFVNWVCGDKVQPAYLWYCLQAMTPEYDRLRFGSTHQTIYMPDVAQFKVPLPPPTEQERIANFLDEQTARIDALIAEKEALLERLSELRYSLVSWAVAGGLHCKRGTVGTGNPFVPELPSGWTLGGLTKYIGPVVDYRGKTPEKVDDGVLLVTARNIRDGELDYGAAAEFVRAEDYEDIMRRGVPKVGDVLFTMEAPLGQVANVDREDIALAQRVVKFRGVPGVLNNYYLKYWLMGDAVQSTLSTLATGSTAEGIKASKLGQIPLALPSPAEQDEIVKFLDERRSAINSAAAHVAEHLARLREYRSSLISAVVTGQLDLGAYGEKAA